MAYTPDPDWHSQVMNRATEHRGEILDRCATTARRLAPRLTGYLASSIYSDHAAGRFGASAKYSPYVELGHNVVDRHGNVVGYAPAQPFLRPALYTVMA